MKMKMKSLLLSLLSLSFFSSSFLSLEASPSPFHTETQQLISFKSSLQNSSVLQNWLPNKDPCGFTGVSCTENRVSSIDLSSLPLSVDFSFVASFLLSLDALVSISLSSSNVSGSISGFKCGSVLTTVDFSVNRLFGDLTSLAHLGSCQNLKFLNVSTNFLEFSEKETGGFPLTSLEALDLSFNHVSGTKVVSWFGFHRGCKKLKSLVLKGNKISGDADFSGCESLRVLDLSANNFSTGVPYFGDCLVLEHLDVSSNKFSGDISGAVSPCKELKFLNISGNQFSGPVPVLPVENLEFLSLAHNHFHGEIPSFISDACSSLVKLDLSTNNLSGGIPASLGSCWRLESLDLSSNVLSGELPISTLLKMSKLKEVLLSFNEFSGALNDSLSGLNSLETLDLSSNNLSGDIPRGLCQSPSPRSSYTLRELYLQNNQFTGTIPATLSNCSNLVSLHLGLNYLTGTIPASLGLLTKLRDLKLWLNLLEGEIPEELMYIQTLETLILDFNELSGGLPNGLSNCTNLNWISLSNNKLTGEIPSWIGQFSNLAILKLSNNSFYGRIPPELGDCRSLLWLDLNTNLLNGTIPPDLFKQSGKIAVNSISGKLYAYNKNDGSIKQCHGAGSLLEFQGISTLARLSTRSPCIFNRIYKGLTQPTFNNNGSLIFLDISYNLLSGIIPKEIGSMSYLFIMNLGHNTLSGPIPHEIGELKGLNILDISSNGLEGVIPQSMSALTMLNEIDLSNNNLTGTIPEMGQLETFEPNKFMNNSGLCGYPLPPCRKVSSAGTNSPNSHKRQASLVGSVAMGLLFSLFIIFGMIIVLVEMKKRRNAALAALDIYVDTNSRHGPASNTDWKLTTAREALSINLATFEKPLQKLTFADLLEATNGFQDDSMIGSGGFGDVYKAQLKDGSIVAIKKLTHVSGQGDREFMSEMKTIGKIKHRNLVPLLGYCMVGEERLLVYEYMKFGSLEDVLHDPKKSGVKLNWAARRKIAVGAARGLVFLHHSCNPHIIHRDMKSSNVLIDETLEARVSDFGMARLVSAVDTHLSVSTLAGTPGYVPPEYYQSFRCSTKGDVYSYGVVLLELLTGKKPTNAVEFGDNNLVGWVKLHAKLKISDVFDRELLKEEPSLVLELLQHLKLATACLDDRPWKRPTMLQVMNMFREIQAESGIESQSIEMVDMTIKEDP